ncbi:MAG: hypothetical protein IPN71_06985 [Fibrobacteres bacterium]|jgi:hypothetical protein|nr:hypothetical protein [Fibrobacterota bacterium]
MKLEVRFAFCVLLAAAVCACAQQIGTLEPEHKQAVYVRPIELLAMGGGLFIPKTELVWIHLDAERYIVPGWSAVAGIQNLSAKNTDNSNNSGEFGFFDAVVGGRWYPTRPFSGYYVQSQFDYNSISMHTEKGNGSETGDLTGSRFGMAFVTGYNIKGSRLAFDWNVGLCVFASPKFQVDRRYNDGRAPVTLTLDDAFSEPAVSKYKSYVNMAVAGFMPTMNLAVGVQF